MRKINRLLAILCVLALVLGMIPVISAAETYVLPVFETSDVHGFLADTSSADESTYQYRLAYIADKVDDIRNGDSSRTILLDGGDIYQGNVVSNLQDGEPMSAAFDAMEYDAVALGNHEFDWGIDKTTDPDGTMTDYSMNGITYENDIPIVCGNLYYRSTGNRVEFTQDYVIVDKTSYTASGKTMDVKIAIIGYISDYSSSIMASKFTDFMISGSVSAAESLAKSLKNSGQADAAILLAHEDAAELAGKLSSSSAFDLVCGGHSHFGQSGKSGRTTYIQPGSQAIAYAYAQLSFDSSKNVTVIDASIKSITADEKEKEHTYDTPANAEYLAPDVLELSHYYIDGVNEALTTELGYITTSVTGDAIGGNSQSSTAGNWMTDLANRATGSKVSFTNTGGIRTSFYVNGGRRTITKGDIYTIAPFGNLLYVYEVTYAQLLELLEYGTYSGLKLRMSGIDCYYSGRSVTALVEDGVCIYKDGKWLNGMQTEKIRVSANEFIATSSGTPFYELNSTCLVDHTMVDNESFIRVLEQERDNGDGFLYVDPNPHYINGTYNGNVNAKYTITTSYEGKGTVTPSATVDFGARFVVTFQPDDGWEMTSLIIDGAKYSPRESFTFGSVTSNHTVHAVFSEKACDHSGKTATDRKDASCTASGYEKVYCADCGELLSETTFNALGHNYVNGVCTRCGAPDPDYDFGHTHSYTEKVVAPTCTQNGYTVHTCTICGISYNDSETAALGHNYVNGICTRCGAKDPNSQPSPVDCDGGEACPAYSFSDVNAGDWYHEAVDYTLKNGLMNGVGGGRFDPDGSLTRAMLVTILYRSENTPDVSGESNPFADVPDGQWYTDAVIWAAKEGIVNGTSKTTFAPNDSITREQIATILYRYDGAVKVSGDLDQFSDASDVSTYALDAMVWAVKEGIIGGMNGKLSPKDNATRAQIATILYRYLGQ